MKSWCLLLASFVCLTCLGQDWHANHFGGWSVPTITNAGDVATLPIPGPNSNIRLVSTLTTTNSPWLLGDLTGKTISTLVWMQFSNNPVLYFNNNCGNGVPSNMRLFFTTDINPYTEDGGKGNETGYWWCYATNGCALTTEGTNVMQALVAPYGWSDAFGHYASDTNYISAFQNAAQHVAQTGLSFGGGCYYDVGVGVAGIQEGATNTGASATLHVLRYDVLVNLPVVWQYPTGIVASNYWWNVESSPDLRNWSVVISNVTGPGVVRVKRTDPPGFYRLAGRLSP